MLGFLHRNVAALLLSLGLSFTLWAVVVNQQNPEITRVFDPAIPVETRNVPAGLVVQGSSNETVRLQITTTLDHWNSVSPTSFHAYVDLTKAEAGAREYPVQVDNSDGRVRVASIDPTQTEVRLSLLKRKTVPVRVNITDSVPFGFESQPPTITPDQIEVIGPQSLVESVVTAVVDLPLSGARTTINQTFKPEPRDGAGKPVKGVDLNPSLVVVELPIEQQVSYKLVPVVPQVVGTVALGYQVVGIVPDPASVTVVGEPQALEQLTQISTQAVDVNNLSSDLHQSTELVLPSGVSLARKQGVVVRVYVNAIQGMQTMRVTPTVIGAAEASQVTVVPGTVDVTLSGEMPSLLQLRPQDVRAVIDVSGHPTGTFQVTPQVTVPAGLKIEKVAPDTVMVTLK